MNIDRRLLTPDLMEFYGIKSRATFIKKEREGKILKRHQYPDGRLGNMLSECMDWAITPVISTEGKQGVQYA